jgi:hypothetical protein
MLNDYDIRIGKGVKALIPNYGFIQCIVKFTKCHTNYQSFSISVMIASYKGTSSISSSHLDQLSLIHSTLMHITTVSTHLFVANLAHFCSLGPV